MRPHLALSVGGLLLAACGAPGAGAVGDRAFRCNGMDARTVLHELEKHGAVLTNVREGAFYFYGDEASLAKLDPALRALGFETRPTETDPGRIATIDAVINEEWFAVYMPKLCKLSTDLGITYDGWEASVPEAQRKE